MGAENPHSTSQLLLVKYLIQSGIHYTFSVHTPYLTRSACSGGTQREFLVTLQDLKVTVHEKNGRF